MNSNPESYRSADGGVVTPLRDKGLEDKFQDLSQQWKFETGHMSIASQIAMHPAYQRIIAMGEQAIPLILEDLRKEPHHWFWALSALADCAPIIPEKDKGNIRAMSDAWIEWGKRKRYIDE